MTSTRNTISKVIKKRARTQISLEVKFKIVQTLEKGEKINNVARLYNLNESTIRTIKKNADAIKMAVKDSIPTSSKIVKYTRNNVMVKMEKLLFLWIEDNNKKHIEINTRNIQTKALSIFNQLKKQNEEKSISFVASKGWFDKFKKRYLLLQLLQSHDSKLITNDPIELNQEDKKKGEQEDDKKATDLFTNENIKDYISMIQKATDFIESIDPDHERRGSIHRGLKAQIVPYEFILEERKGTNRQQTLDRFFIPSTSIATTDVTVEYSSSESDFD